MERERKKQQIAMKWNSNNAALSFAAAQKKPLSAHLLAQRTVYWTIRFVHCKRESKENMKFKWFEEEIEAILRECAEM